MIDIDNDDPIKEYKTFRPGIDNLIENDEINSFEDDTSVQYSNLHECSDDLSDRGSKIEEIAHAKYAEAKRRAISNGANKQNNNVNTDSNKAVAYIIIFICIIIPLIEFLSGIIAIVVHGFNSIVENNSYQDSSGYHTNLEYDFSGMEEIDDYINSKFEEMQ